MVEIIAEFTSDAYGIKSTVADCGGVYAVTLHDLDARETLPLVRRDHNRTRAIEYAKRLVEEYSDEDAADAMERRIDNFERGDWLD